MASVIQLLYQSIRRFNMMRKYLSVFLFCCFLLFCASPVLAEDFALKAGNIFLYGEIHSDSSCLEKELEAWSEYYGYGMRDLFIEFPSYTAACLNRWMHQDTDELLDMVFTDLQGTNDDSPQNRNFYRSIKSAFPETVFHGTDVGHQFDTTGARYLSLLESEGKQDTPEYRLVSLTVEQGQKYYDIGRTDKTAAVVYREYCMVDNFLRTWEELGRRDIMGIYGSAHTDPFSLDLSASIPCMAAQLKGRLQDAVHSKDLTKKDIIRTDTVSINGKEYQASYFGSQDISSWAQGYLKRDFWRVENAYDDMKDAPRTGNWLPAGNYNMTINTGEIYIVEYTKADGTPERLYYLCDGTLYNGVLNTFGIAVNE